MLRLANNMYITSTNKILYYELLIHSDLKKILHMLDSYFNKLIDSNRLIHEIEHIFESKYTHDDTLIDSDISNIHKLILLESFDYTKEIKYTCAECGNIVERRIHFDIKINDVKEYVNKPDNSLPLNEYGIELNKHNKSITSRMEMIELLPSNTMCLNCGDVKTNILKVDNIVNIINFINSQYGVKYMYQIERFLMRYGKYTLNDISNMYIFEHRVYMNLITRENTKKTT